jgi:hypothetical protein
VRPCLERLEERAVPVVFPTASAFTHAATSYTLFNQQDKVTVQVTSPTGGTVNEGQVVITDAGQTQTVAVSGGTASATFTIKFLSELPQAHGVSATYSDPTPSSPLKSFGTSTAGATIPNSSAGYFWQLYVDLYLAQYYGLI